MLKPKRARGLTLIELLMALVVLAIGATLAAPGIASMIASRRVQSLSQSLLGMNFIGSLSGFDVRGDRMILRD